MIRLTAWPLLLDIPLQYPVQRLARHLPRKHEHYLNLAVRPYQRCVYYAEGLRHEGEPCTEVGNAIGGVLRVLEGQKLLEVKGVFT
jgi:hypothetical protein